MRKSEKLLKNSHLFRALLSMIFLAGVVSVSVFPVTGRSQGNLFIMPRRVVFEGVKKSQELTLANTGKDTAVYVVSFIQIRMTEEGTFDEITIPDSGQYFSDQYFRIFPRTVVLAPKKSQVVKMQLIKKAKMIPGEYRSHLYFRSVPREKPLGEATTQLDPAAVNVHLVPVFGITIPAIIRVGECEGKVDIKDITVGKVNDTVTRVKMKLMRTGNISVYGNMMIDYTSLEGKVTRVAAIKGIAVYTPKSFRTFECDLDRLSGVDYHKGKLNVVYSTPEDIKSSKLAEAEVMLN